MDATLRASSGDTVIYVPTLSYLSDNSRKMICEQTLSHKSIFTIEENSIIGGLGDEIFNILSQEKINLPNRFEKIGIPHKFLNKYGTSDQHRKDLGLDEEGIRRRIAG